ncbi:MAG: 5'/3'-nucleotidase SurE [Nitrospirae bacterium]|nr:MAG: 5'/3'-nucleotidase SurE [Nitrospirota bacterium]
MKILVVNDDGITSAGIHALAKVMKKLGDVWVVAPERPQNAVGRAMTLHKPLRLIRVRKQQYAVNGTPADCVTLGVDKLLQDNPPVLVVSGINQGLNLGDDVTNSGTVAAALEAAIRGIPAMAISLEGQRVYRYHVAALVAYRVAERVLRNGLPSDTLLNVNVPHRGTAQKLEGVKVTSLARRRYANPVVEKLDPRGEKYYWIAGEQRSWTRAGQADYEAISQGYVSITPLRVDMTHYRAMRLLRSWESALTACLHEPLTEKNQERHSLREM